LKVSSHGFNGGFMPYQPKLDSPQPLCAVLQACGSTMVIMDSIGTAVRPLSRLLVLPLVLPLALLSVLPAPVVLPLVLLSVLPAPLVLPLVLLSVLPAPLVLPLVLLSVLPAPLVLPLVLLSVLPAPLVLPLVLLSVAPPWSLRPPHRSARCSSHLLLPKRRPGIALWLPGIPNHSVCAVIAWIDTPRLTG